MKFVICTNEEMILQYAGVSEDDLGGYTAQDLVRVGAIAAAGRLSELCGFDAYKLATYSPHFQYWNGGKFSQRGKYAPYQNCGFVACDINSPSMPDIAHEADLAYRKAIDEFVAEIAETEETITNE